MSKVWLENNSRPWWRFVELRYPRWPVDDVVDVEDIDDQLRYMLPKGCRWYGGLVLVEDDELDDVKSNCMRRCLQVLVDFADVQHETHLTVEAACFVINGVQACVAESFMHGDQNGDLDGALNENVLGAYHYQLSIEDTVVPCGAVGDRLVEEIENDVEIRAKVPSMVI